MGRYKSLFNEKQGKTQIETIEALINEVNSASENYAPDKKMEIPDKMLDELLEKYTLEQTVKGQERHLKINVKKMLKESKLRGQLEERLIPILDGLLERGARFNNQRIRLSVDMKELVANASSAPKLKQHKPQ